MQRELETTLARKLLEGSIQENSRVRVDVVGGQLRFESEFVAEPV